jgi:malonate transporter and related proteins
MLSTLQILLPGFGLVFAGFACRRRGVLGPSAASELNRFVVWLALPALLFDITAHATRQQFYQPAFVDAFALAAGAVFVLILTLRMLSGRHLADASVDAIAASYPNTGYVGFPLCMIVFGAASLTPTAIATILVTCVLFALAIVLIELGLQTERKPHKLGLAVVRSLARNPLIVSPVARVFALPLTLVQMAVVLAALPTGTGPFMLAEFYRREAHITSRTILLSTLGSLVSLSLLLSYMPRNG